MSKLVGNAKEEIDRIQSFLSEINKETVAQPVFVTKDQLLKQQVSKIRRHLLFHAIVSLSFSIFLIFLTFHSHASFPFVIPDCKLAFFISFYISTTINCIQIALILKRRYELSKSNVLEHAGVQHDSRKGLVFKSIGRFVLTLFLFEVKCELCGVNLFVDVRAILGLHFIHILAGFLFEMNLEQNILSEQEESLRLEDEEVGHTKVVEKFEGSFALNLSEEDGTTTESLKYIVTENSTDDILEGITVVKMSDHEFRLNNLTRQIKRNSPSKCLLHEFKMAECSI